MHGIIIGGGIGGMALAAALERVGISYEVHEQVEELREVGAGLTLWSNAQIALARLGAAEALTLKGSIVARLEVHRAVLVFQRCPGVSAGAGRANRNYRVGVQPRRGGARVL